MKTPDSEKLVRQLRRLNDEMDQANPDPIQMRKFRDLFRELDSHLHHGGILPPSWITPDNRTQLKPHQTHTITDFDPPVENTTPSSLFAWCGHRLHPSSTQHCSRPTCGNYITINANPAKSPKE